MTRVFHAQLDDNNDQFSQLQTHFVDVTDDEKVKKIFGAMSDTALRLRMAAAGMLTSAANSFSSIYCRVHF